MQWNPVEWISDSRQFILEVRSEFRKVTWPSQKEALAYPSPPAPSPAD